MITPEPMLISKHQIGAYFMALLAFVTLLAGCTPPGPKALLEGERLIQQGKFAEAAQELRTATKLMATNALAWNYLGLACHYSGQSAEAVKAYQKALALDRDLTEAHYNLGSLWLEQNKIESAKAEFTACTLRRADFTNAYLKLGNIHLRLRETSAAERAFGEALKLSTNNVEALTGLGLARVQRNRQSDAVQYFYQALRMETNYSPAVLNLAILAHQHFQDRPAALQNYRKYLALEPNAGNAAEIQALVEQLERETTVAPRPSGPAPPSPVARAAVTNTVRPFASAQVPPAATNAPKRESPTASAKPTMTAAGTGAKAPQTAQTGLPAPATAKPAPAVVNTNLEVVQLGSEPVYKQGGDVAIAPKTASQSRPAPTAPAASAPVSVASGKSMLRYAYLSPAKPKAGNRKQAERSFAQAFQAHRANRLNEAMQGYRATTQIDPAYFEAQYNLALASADAGNLKSALAAYEKALAIAPDSIDARYNFALVLKQSGYYLDAAAELQKLISRYPNDTRSQLALGNLYAQQLKNPAKAREHYLKVLDLDPRHPQSGAIQYWLAENPK